MKTPLSSSLLVGALLGAAVMVLPLSAQGTKPAAPAPVSGERFTTGTITATVAAINHETREVTLKGPLGNDVSFVASKEVQRLNEVAVGDKVTVDYLVSLAGEVRAPTEAEKKNPYAVSTEHARAPDGKAPAAGIVRTIRVVGTIEKLDDTIQLVTLKGPRGNTLPVRVDNPAKFKQLHVGDSVIMTYSEAMAISLHKVSAGK
jgi:hypothetical protein